MGCSQSDLTRDSPYHFPVAPSLRGMKLIKLISSGHASTTTAYSHPPTLLIATASRISNGNPSQACQVGVQTETMRTMTGRNAEKARLGMAQTFQAAGLAGYAKADVGPPTAEAQEHHHNFANAWLRCKGRAAFDSFRACAKAVAHRSMPKRLLTMHPHRPGFLSS